MGEVRVGHHTLIEGDRSRTRRIGDSDRADQHLKRSYGGRRTCQYRPNPVVGETNDGRLNNIRAKRVTQAHVVDAITSARGGVTEEGNVGAGTGTLAFGFKGGIGTSSRATK